MNFGTNHYFRGMASDKWRLKTSIDRLLDEVRKTNKNPLLSETNQNTLIEIKAQDNFVKNQSQNLNRLFGRSTDDNFIIDNETFLHLPVILQHYGYPTRIQDWTTSWEIALFFALENKIEVEDCCIWAINNEKIPDVEECIDDDSFLYKADLFEKNRINSFYHRLIPGVYILKKGFFKRITAQSGITLVSGRADYMDFEQHIIESKWLKDGDVEKMIIEKSLRTEILYYLDIKNITHDSLYPKDITDGYVDSDLESIKRLLDEMYLKKK